MVQNRHIWVTACRQHWMALDYKIFRKSCNHLGLFFYRHMPVTSTNIQRPMSFLPDIVAIATDVFYHKWEEFSYNVPPFNLIPRTLNNPDLPSMGKCSLVPKDFNYESKNLLSFWRTQRIFLSYLTSNAPYTLWWKLRLQSLISEKFKGDGLISKPIKVMVECWNRAEHHKVYLNGLHYVRRKELTM